MSQISRPIPDAPSYLASSGAKDHDTAAWQPLSSEAQLWIEVSLLMILGLIMIYSASSITALKAFSDASHYLKRQLFSIFLGLIIMITASRFPYQRYKEAIRWILPLTILALILVLIPGIGAEINNARRWFNLGIFLLQPAEYAKVVWVLYLSVSLAHKGEKIKKFSKGFLPYVILCMLFCALFLGERDFGTTFIVCCLTFAMLMVGGVLCRQLFLLIPLALLGFYQFVMKVPYRLERVTTFLNPFEDPLDSGYQLIQAWIAVGSGGLWGKGLGAGQQKLFYLPEPYTDFILAVLGEELGFLGLTLVCVLFLLFFRTGCRISQKAPDLMGTLLAMGITMLLSLQALLNMGVVLGLFPTKGLPLPFISYGGSAFTANCLAVGILMNIARSADRRVEG